jgi:2-polyprenyl-6-methoxyphenol hydroxylase-like FAD-dependent oxidoreductase
MDVLWFKLEKGELTGAQPLGRFSRGQILILIDRGGYWQAGYVIAKGGLETLQAAGFEAFRRRIAALAPVLEEPLAALKDWSETSLLTVQVNRLERWHRPGLLCIGDAAHAMSPVGGIGINLAIQDAVAAANRLALPLRKGRLEASDLEAVQERRLWPARITQRVQIMIQNRLIAEALTDRGIEAPPLPLRLLAGLPLLKRLPGRFIGLGIRPERPAAFLRA